MSSAEEILQFECPKCGKRLRAGRKIAGRRVKCPKCEHEVRVPGSPQKKQDADDWLELDTPAIADLPARSAASEKTRAENEQKRERHRVGRKPTVPDGASQPKRGGQDGARLSRKAKIASGENTASVPKPKAEKQPTASPSQEAAGSIPADLGDELSLEPETPRKPVAQSSPAKNSNGNRPSAASDRANVDGSRAGAKGQPPPSVFDEEDFGDDFKLAEPEDSPPKKKKDVDSLLAAQLGEELLSDLEDDAGPLPPLGAEPVQEAESVDEDNPRYRITCPICDTPQYVRLAQKGSKIKCPDCFHVYAVPAPSAAVLAKNKKKKPTSIDDGPGLALSPTDESINTSEKREKSQAAKILEKAKSDVSEDEIDDLYGDGEFDTKGFVQRTFGCFKDPICLAQIVGYAIVFGLLFAGFQWTGERMNSAFGKGLMFVTMLIMPLVVMLFSLPMLAAGLALIESVANNEPRVKTWPGFDLFDNMGDVFVVLIALAASFLPGGFIGGVLGNTLSLGVQVQLTGIMLTTFALFPIILLSLLDNGSLFQPISGAIISSLKEAAESWGGYYLKTMVGFGAVTLAWYLLIGHNVVTAAIAGMLIPVLFFFVCQQIGALADGIAEHLSFEFSVESDEEDEE